MEPLRNDIASLTVVLAVSLLLLPVRTTVGGELPVAVAPQQQEDEYNEDWYGHIDNQAYLERRKRLREEQQDMAPIVIVDSLESRDAIIHDWYCGECGSRLIEYYRPDYTFSYRDGYRPNRPPPVYIRTAPHNHHRERYGPEHRVRPERDNNR